MTRQELSQQYDEAYLRHQLAQEDALNAHRNGWDRHDAPEHERRKAEKRYTQERKAARRLREAEKAWAQSVGWE